MQKILIQSVMCRRKPIRYYLLAETEKDGRKSYGICVEYGVEAQQIRRITASQKQINRLLSLLVNGCVTPIAVRYVVEDWLLA